MAKISKKRSKKGGDVIDESGTGSGPLQEQALRLIYAILLFIIALFLIFSAAQKAGWVGNDTYYYLREFLGIGYFLIPIIFVTIGIFILNSIKQKLAWPKLVGSFLFLLSSLGLINLTVNDGGYIGRIISNPLRSLFDLWVTFIFLSGLLIISIIITFDTHLFEYAFNMMKKWFYKEKLVSKENEIKIQDSDVEKISPQFLQSEKENSDEKVPENENAKEKISDVKKFLGISKKKNTDDVGITVSTQSYTLNKKFTPPPISLLEIDKGKPGVGDIKANANIIKRTLQNFGITVEMDEISIGPSVTRYALKPAEGVKLSRIIGLQNDLALALAAHPIRIEAPIPGKSLVGIEIPNSTKTTVGLGSLLATEEFQQSDKPLLISLGKGISGKSYFANLAKAPHMLIAGATGSGKSVTIHAILTSLLYRVSPDNLKFIMIDPKRVELTLYNKIPHLLTPVITEAKKAILALKWAAKEMDRRYDILETEKVRDIESYHKNILAPAVKKMEKKEIKSDEETSELPETMPYIVIIIDELADIMQTYPRELESAIVRLAQMSRAVGIHLILSTQRPSVNVITGLIKANVPSRIALQVASQIDSRTILDSAGAEKLLGAGDMLFQSGEMSKPQRVQSAFISETELKNVVKYLVDTYADVLPSEINLTNDSEQGANNPIFSSSMDDDDNDEDDLYEEARDIVVKAGKASTSYLQRKLRVGYARAARLVDMLEERGVIGPGEGSKPREVINSTVRSDNSNDSVNEV